MEAINERQKRLIFTKLSDAFDGDFAGKRITVLGLSSPIPTTCVRLPVGLCLRTPWSAGVMVQACDSKPMQERRHIYGDRADLIRSSQEQALLKTDALVICTEWKTFCTAETSLFASICARRLWWMVEICSIRLL